MLLQEEAIIREFELGPATGERTLVVGVQEMIQVRGCVGCMCHMYVWGGKRWVGRCGLLYCMWGVGGSVLDRFVIVIYMHHTYIHTQTHNKTTQTQTQAHGDSLLTRDVGGCAWLLQQKKYVRAFLCSWIDGCILVGGVVGYRRATTCVQLW